MTVVSFDRVLKEIKKLPIHIQEKALNWSKDVEKFGLSQVFKSPGLHDEPLKGNRTGQRSIRLSRSYRLIYTVIDTQIIIVKVLEINKHEY